MADASDSKSDVGDHVWVQVPSPALKKASDDFVWGFSFARDTFPSVLKPITSEKSNYGI